MSFEKLDVMKQKNGFNLVRALLSASIEALLRFHTHLKHSYRTICTAEQVEDDKNYRNAFTQAKKSFNVIKAQCAGRVPRLRDEPEDSVSQSEDAAEHKETSN
ncbi:hypothetical protein K435DRAFT_872297 [Dendrothele bispora CBS 962.96]|uniref:Uncharacterized protein n=1 Tax=Dendrothele bispora (strain CBS 962.96) TaxID=1314807 RepID=A0A4S8L1Z3_DENBC|nr:hypothetical protein K435DRAFT_872297 [Dendrothele bispora CBS 962.96]